MFLVSSIPSQELRPDQKKFKALVHMLMPRDVSKLHSLPGGVSFYLTFLPNSAKRKWSVNDLLHQRVPFCFTLGVGIIVTYLLREPRQPHGLMCLIDTRFSAA